MIMMFATCTMCLLTLWLCSIPAVALIVAQQRTFREVRFVPIVLQNISWMRSRRNVRSAAHSVSSLPCHVNSADESMLRDS
jgi:hypothetical protein